MPLEISVFRRKLLVDKFYKKQEIERNILSLDQQLLKPKPMIKSKENCSLKA